MQYLLHLQEIKHAFFEFPARYIYLLGQFRQTRVVITRTCYIHKEGSISLILTTDFPNLT